MSGGRASRPSCIRSPAEKGLGDSRHQSWYKHCMQKPPDISSSRTIVAQAPCRADLAGGTLDLWPLYLFHPGALTLNFALNILTTCRITPLQGKTIHLRSLDTRCEQGFASLDELCRTKRFRLPLAAKLVQFFAPRQGLLIETDS